LMTVHSAKGLEFPTVFLVGMEDGVFPHSRSINDEKDLEEERRLAYVAITRAEKILYVTHAMRRRTYGEDMAAEPSQFLNEMPLELIEDVSSGSSWLSFARGSTNAKAAVAALRGESRPEKPKNLYTGKTYNSADAVAEFFRKKEGEKGRRGERETDGRSSSASVPNSSRESSAFDRLKAAGSKNPRSAIRDPRSINPGNYVRHEKYGRGLVLRREGTGDNSKLTISFPGFGQKKLIEKFANLTRIE